MSRILEDNFKEYEVRCPHCGTKIGFTLVDVWSSYERGLEYSEGWCDCDCLWHYITCPKCEKIIAVNDIENSPLTTFDNKYLTQKYEHNW